MKVSLALGGGGSKGLAHIGVIDCLEKSGFKVAAIAGTSIGGLVGAIYASGYSASQILSTLENVNPSRMYGRSPNNGPSLLGYHGLADLLTRLLGDIEFSDLRIAFACTAVDIRSANEVYLNTGRVMDAVLATLAIPGIFPPRIFGHTELIDGGILDPVPVRLARLLAPDLPVIAVPLNPEREAWDQLPRFNLAPVMPLPIPVQILEGFSRLRVGQALQIFAQSMDITSRMLTEVRMEVDRPEVIIRPSVHQYGLLDTVHPKELYAAGMEATQQALPKIRRELSWARTVYRILRRPSRHKTEEEKENSSLRAVLKKMRGDEP